MNLWLGVIQQLRGQEGGEAGVAKSPRLSTQGGGMSLDVHVDKTLKKKYRRILANELRMQYIEGVSKLEGES